VSSIRYAARKPAKQIHPASVLSAILGQICPEDFSLPSLSQLENLSDEVTSVYMGQGLSRIMWGIELNLKHSKRYRSIRVARGNRGHVPRPLLAEDMAKITHTLAPMEPGQKDTIIRSSSSSLSWIAAFSHQVVELKVVLELQGGDIIWEFTPFTKQKEQYNTLQLILVEVDADPDFEPLHRNFEVLLPAQVQIRLNRLDLVIRDAHFPVSIVIICRRKLDRVRSSDTAHRGIMEHVSHGFYHMLLHGRITSYFGPDFHPASMLEGPIFPFDSSCAQKALDSIARTLLQLASMTNSA
jgi:hypothetical protein